MSAIRMFSVAVALLGLAAGCEPKAGAQGSSASHPSPAAQGDRSTAPSASKLTLVTDRSLVCMVNNQFMDKPQIPIEVEGRTYYGCCEMCKERLGADPSSRVAVDPVTGKTVDKASAVIAQDAGGKTFYFESDQTFATFAGSTAR